MSRFGWWGELTRIERRTYSAAFGGLALDSMDTTIYALVTPTLIALLGITKPEAGLLATGNLLGAAVGGWCGGILADRFGRVRVLQATILIVAAATFSAAFANGFWYLLAARVAQGVGYGAEAAVGAVLVMEVVQARLRGKVAASVQSGYAVGNAISVGLLPVLFGFLPPDLAWRCFFAIGLLPAVIVLFIRRYVPESALFLQQGGGAAGAEVPFWTIFNREYAARTALATAFTTGMLGAAYVLITWLPTYMVTVLHLEVGRTAGYLALNIFGSFCGPFAFGLLSDRLGRRGSFMLVLVLQAANLLVYTQAPVGTGIIFVLGFFLGAFQAGLASGLMPTFSELFPTRIRANGAGFAFSAGRGFGSVVPAAVGLLSARMPLGDAMVWCALAAYGLAFIVAILMPIRSGADLLSAGSVAAAPRPFSPPA